MFTELWLVIYVNKRLISCHSYRVNHACGENLSVHRLTIIAQILCSLKRITVTSIELKRENQFGVKLRCQNTLIEQSPRNRRA